VHDDETDEPMGMNVAAPEGEIAVDVQHVAKRFRLYHERGTSLKERLVKTRTSRYEDLWALKDVSFQVAEGETIGILGRNGSGKSTLLKTICGVLQPTDGQIMVRGKLAGLLELGAGFQAELSGRDNIYLNGSMLGLSKKEVDAVFDDIVEFAELEHFIDNQVKFYSSGMYVRLGFAVAVNVDPDILVIDEVLAVGDERFQDKCMDRIRQFQQQGRTIIFVSHSADQVRAICDRVVVLKEGRMVGVGAPGEAIRRFREGLLEAGAQVAVPDGADVVDEVQTEEEIEEAEEQAAIERPVRLGDVTVVYPHGADKRYIHSRDPLEIKVAFHATEPVEGVVFEFEFWGPAGFLLFKTDTDNMGVHFDLDEGDGEMVFTFPSMPFLDRTYRVALGIQSRLGGVTYDWCEDAARVEVLYEGKTSGLLNLPMDAALVSGGTETRDAT
jgi:ABC-2 type transport system ATP-binding protein